MSVRKRKGSPYFWYSFSLAGRRFRGSTGKTSKREAEEVERDQRHLQKSAERKGGEWPLIAVLNAYWHEHGKDRKGHVNIERALGLLQKALGRDTKASQLTNGALMDYRAKRRGEGVMACTVNREFAYLRAAYEHCAKFHRQPMPWIEWKKLKAAESPHRTRFLSIDEYEALMAAAHESLRPIIICAVTTGLRRGNIEGLDWRQVKLGERMIQIVVKGNKRHSVKIGGALMAVLSRTPPELRKGKVFDTVNVRKRFEAAVKAAGLEDFRFHDLRHTFASWARIDGADLADIFEALNHSSMSMTMRYAHVTPETHRTAFDRVSDRILAQSLDCGSDKPTKKHG